MSEGINQGLIPAAGYTRCSTVKQEMSLGDQKIAINEFAQENGYKVVEWFEDFGKSGTTRTGRPKFDELIRRITSGDHGFKAILVYDTDRWGRFPDTDETSHYHWVCKEGGAPAVFVRDASIMNRDDMSSQLIKPIKQALDTEESRKKSELTFERSKLNAGRGFSSGGFPPYGYSRMLLKPDGTEIGILKPGEHKAEKSQKVHWVIGDPEKVETVRRIFTMFSVQGVGLRTIANSLNSQHIPSPSGGKWNISTLSSMLSNSTYLGDRNYGQTVRGIFQRRKVRAKCRDEWVVTPNAHQPIIDKDLFDHVQRRLQSSKNAFAEKAKSASMRTATYLLSPFMVCRNCGSRFHGHTHRNNQGRIYHRYADSGYKKHGSSVCGRFTIDRNQIEASVLGAIENNLSRRLSKKRMIGHIKKLLIQQDRSDNHQGEALAMNLRQVDLQLARIRKAIRNGLPESEFEGDFKELYANKERLAAQLSTIAAKAPKQIDLEGLAQKILEKVRHFRRILRSGNPAQVKRLLGLLIDRIEIDRKNLQAFLYLRQLPALAAAESIGGKCASVYMPEAGIEPAREKSPKGF